MPDYEFPGLLLSEVVQISWWTVVSKSRGILYMRKSISSFQSFRLIAFLLCTLHAMHSPPKELSRGRGSPVGNSLESLLHKAGLKSEMSDIL